MDTLIATGPYALKKTECSLDLIRLSRCVFAAGVPLPELWKPGKGTIL